MYRQDREKLSINNEKAFKACTSYFENDFRAEKIWYIAVLAIKSAIQLWLNTLNGQMHCSIRFTCTSPYATCTCRSIAALKFTCTSLYASLYMYLYSHIEA